MAKTPDRTPGWRSAAWTTALALGLACFGSEPETPLGDEIEPPPGALRTPEATASAPPAVVAGDPGPDQEELASWFEQQVRAQLEQGEPAAPPEPEPPPARAAPRRVEPAEPEPPPDPEVLQARVSSGEVGGINWDYLQDVSEGRVGGVPNEAAAGLSLSEIDRLVEVPYLKELRDQGRVDELEALGLGIDRERPLTSRQ